MHRIATAAGSLAAAAALTAFAAQAETVKITVVGAPPPMVTVVQVTKEYFVPEVTKRLAASGKDFKIEWVEAYSQSLGKFTEVLETVEEGIAHLGVQIHAFEEAKLPLENMPAYAPFGSDDPHAVARMANALRAKVPELDQQWGKYNQIYLATGVDDAIQIMTLFPVTKFEDLKGKKIGASGTWAATCATPAPSSSPRAWRTPSPPSKAASTRAIRRRGAWASPTRSTRRRRT
jgi:TRAP-type C4-dicarboxylate transport system substrate-binding protein